MWEYKVKIAPEGGSFLTWLETTLKVMGEDNWELATADAKLKFLIFKRKVW